MKVAYVVNQYPKVSHSFIRREILALEELDTEILRIALRGWDQPLVDGDDQIERERTNYVLKAGIVGLALAFLRECASNPLRLLGAFRISVRLALHSDKAKLKHVACLLEACRVARWVSQSKARHIHAHFGTNSAEVALLAGRIADVPFSFTVHGPEEFDHPEGLCLKQKVRHAARVVAVSSFGRSQLFRWAELSDWSKIEIVRCGVDSAYIDHPEQESSLPNTFVCVGRLCEQKGQLVLVEALAHIKRQGFNCRVVFAGDGEMRDDILNRAASLDVSDCITITGWLDATQIRSVLLECCALVLPSFAEGLPVVLMEAMALGRPVVTTYVAGIPELVRAGENGWLVPAGDPTRLAEAMVECLRCSTAERRALGMAGRARVRSQHDVRAQSALLLELFRSSAI